MFSDGRFNRSYQKTFRDIEKLEKEIDPWNSQLCNAKMGNKTRVPENRLKMDKLGKNQFSNVDWWSKSIFKNSIKINIEIWKNWHH